VKSTKAGYWRNVPISRDLGSLIIELKSFSGDSKTVFPRQKAFATGDQFSVLKSFLKSVDLIMVTL